MKQIILIDDRKEVTNLLEINLLNSFEDLEIITKRDAGEALETMEILPDIPLVICRDVIDEEPTAKNILHFIQQNEYPARIIVLGNRPNIRTRLNITAIPASQKYLDVIRHTSKILKIPVNRNRDDEHSQYSAISINYLLHLETSCCDVFLRIKKRNEPDQYVKVIRAEEIFSREQMSKYARQNIEFLYIYKDKRRDFINFISDLWVEKINALNRSQLPLGKKIESLTIAHEIVAREISHLGISSAAIQLAESLITSIMEGLMEEGSNIPKVLQQIANAQSHYMYKHGHMVFALSVQLLSEMNMTDQKTYKTLCFASLFKDISLIRNPLLSKITTFEELETAKISPKEYNSILNHACESAYALKEYGEIAPKSLELIIRHHGHPGGNGFSNTHFGKFDILDRIFFINCEFIKEFLTFDRSQRKPNQKATPITYRLQKQYFFPEISDAIEILNKTLQKQKNTVLKV